MTNSSPPSGREVIGADAGADPVRDGRQHAVTARMAKKSFMTLNRSSRRRGSRWRGGRQAIFELLEQRPAVGQAGEIVVVAMYSVRASASRRAWSWTSMEATAWRALISAGVHWWRPKCKKPSTPR